MELLIIELAVGAVFLMMGWMMTRMGKLEEEIDNCVQKDAFAEVKDDLKEALHLLNESRVENAVWRGRMERALEKDLESS